MLLARDGGEEFESVAIGVGEEELDRPVRARPVTDEAGDAAPFEFGACRVGICHQQREMVMIALAGLQRFVFDQMQFLTAERVPCAGKIESGAWDERQFEYLAVKVHRRFEIVDMDRDMVQFMDFEGQVDSPG